MDGYYPDRFLSTAIQVGFRLDCSTRDFCSCTCLEPSVGFWASTTWSILCRRPPKKWENVFLLQLYLYGACCGVLGLSHLVYPLMVPQEVRDCIISADYLCVSCCGVLGLNHLVYPLQMVPEKVRDCIPSAAVPRWSLLWDSGPQPLGLFSPGQVFVLATSMCFVWQRLLSVVTLHRHLMVKFKNCCRYSCFSDWIPSL